MSDFLDANREVNYFTTRQVAERLGYKATFSINQLIEKSILPNAFKVKGRWWIPEKDIEAIENMKLENLDVKQVAQKLDLKSEKVTEMIRNNVFPNAFKDVLGVLRIPFEDMEEFQRGKITEEFQMKKINAESVDVAEAMKLLGYKNKNTILKYLHNDYLPNAYKYRKKWRIPLKDIETFRLNFSDIKKELAEKRFLAGNNTEIQNCLDITEVEKILKLDRKQVQSLIRKEALPDAIRFKGRYWIPRASLEEYQRKKEEKDAFNETNLTTQDVARRLNYKNRITINQMITKHGKFPNAFKIGASWRIPITDVEEFEETLAEKSKKIEYTPEVAYMELRDFVDTIGINEQLRKTKELYLQYCLL